jgi:hypothetical protein
LRLKHGKKPEQKKPYSRRFWQFIGVLIVAGIVLAGLEQITLIIDPAFSIFLIIFLIFLIVELVYTVIVRVALLDIIFNTKNGKGIFWTSFVIIISLAVYVPQNLGKWQAQNNDNAAGQTQRDNSSTISYDTFTESCVESLTTDGRTTPEPEARSYCRCIYDTASEELGVRRLAEESYETEFSQELNAIANSCARMTQQQS